VRALKSAQKEVSPKALRYLLAQTGPPPPTLVNPASRVNVSNWHEADIKLRPLFGRYGVESGLSASRIGDYPACEAGRFAKAAAQRRNKESLSANG
jgi:hypothetical protein